MCYFYIKLYKRYLSLQDLLYSFILKINGLLLFLGSFILFYIINKKIINVLDKLKPNRPLKVYNNFYNDRKELYKEYKGNKKGYIYLIVNKLNGKFY